MHSECNVRCGCCSTRMGAPTTRAQPHAPWLRVQSNQCDAPKGSATASFYCGSSNAAAGKGDVCSANKARAQCDDSALAPDCPLVTPLANGDCTKPGNLATSFTNASASEAAKLGIEYGAASMCIGVDGSGGLLRANGGGYPGIQTTCARAECSDGGGLSVLIARALGSGYQRFECPEGEFVELGVSDGFAPGVCTFAGACIATQSRRGVSCVLMLAQPA
jgi:hypothetical protein